MPPRSLPQLATHFANGDHSQFQICWYCPQTDKHIKGILCFAKGYRTARFVDGDHVPCCNLFLCQGLNHLLP